MPVTKLPTREVVDDGDGGTVKKMMEQVSKNTQFQIDETQKLWKINAELINRIEQLEEKIEEQQSDLETILDIIDNLPNGLVKNKDKNKKMMNDSESSKMDQLENKLKKQGDTLDRVLAIVKTKCDWQLPEAQN